MTIRAVLFDFDMTLIDSSDALLNNINKMASHFGRPGCSRERLLQVIGLNSDDFWRAIFGDFDDACAAYYRDECLPHEHELMRAFDGAFDCVRALRSRSVRVGCASNRNNPGRVLRMTGLEPLMDCVVGALDVPRPKPAPDVILSGMRHLDALPGETLYIGDTPIDVAAAQNAGVRCVAVLTSNREETLKEAGAWRLCTGLRDLPALLSGENLL